MERVIGLFDDYDQADQALQALDEADFDHEKLSVLFRKDSAPHQFEEVDQLTEKIRGGAVGGSIAGGIAGLLIGVGAISLPGLGLAIASGTLGTILASTAAGAGAGAATGGLVGALIGLGVSQDRAEAYAEGVKRGGVLLILEAEDERAEMAETIMEKAGAVDIEDRRRDWEEEGWTRYDESAIPPSLLKGGPAQH